MRTGLSSPTGGVGFGVPLHWCSLPWTTLWWCVCNFLAPVSYGEKGTTLHGGALLLVHSLASPGKRGLWGRCREKLWSETLDDYCQTRRYWHIDQLFNSPEGSFIHSSGCISASINAQTLNKRYESLVLLNNVFIKSFTWDTQPSLFVFMMKRYNNVASNIYIHTSRGGNDESNRVTTLAFSTEGSFLISSLTHAIPSISHFCILVSSPEAHSSRQCPIPHTVLVGFWKVSWSTFAFPAL